MNKLALVTLAMGATLAFIPSALADSFGYRSSSINSSTNVAASSSSMRIANEVAESGAFAMSDMIAAFANQNSPVVTSEIPSNVARPTAIKINTLADNADHGSQFNSLLNFGNAGKGILDKGGVLVDISGRQLTLLTGGVSGENSSHSNGHFFFADKGSFHSGSSVSGNNGSAPGRAPALTETPEPGSLVLLGTGLLCMALVLFWKSAKRPSAAETLN